MNTSSARGRGASLAVAALLAIASSGCGGGGGGGGGGGPPVDPPTALTYATPSATFEAKIAIPANPPTVGGGAVEDWSVSPGLPSGLTLDPATGVVSGTPLVATPQAIYTVTASNAGGSTQAALDLTVTLNRADNLAAKTTFTDDDIRYFLGRTHLGGKASDFAAVQAVGIPAYVDQMVEYGFDATFEAQAAGLLVNTTDPVGLEGGFPSQSQIARYWQHLMVNTTTPFQEVMALFWHDHFSSSTTPLESSATYWMRNQITLWRQQGNGNLRTLLLAMARDWVMLRWLNGDANTKNAPNENFAREFWELFTLGVDNGYTQADIVEAARAFTGYRSRFNATTNQEFMEFNTTRHDPNSKTFFGQTIAAQNTTDDYQAVVNITVDHRPVAEFISKKLYGYFCVPAGSPLAADAMAALLRGSNYELKPLLKALFKSEAFFSPAAKAGIVKNPVEHVIGFVRATGLVPVSFKAGGDPAAWPANTLGTLDGDLTTAAMRPSQPPTVNGWPIGDEWLSSQNMLDRGNAILSCIRDRTDQTNAGIDVANILPPVAERTAENVVDTLTTLLHVTATAAERQTYIDYLNSSAGAGGVPSPSPFNGANATHLSERVRGLLYILAQHPTYAIR